MEEKGKLDSVKGFANESRLLGALLARGYNASRVDLPHSTYDTVVELSAAEIIRLQVKTVDPSGSIKFGGGTRGGVDRQYISGVKAYTQDTKTSDVVVGVEAHASNGEGRIDFYFVPTVFIEAIAQKSIRISKVQPGRNNWELLSYCRDKAKVLSLFEHQEKLS